MLSSNFCKLNKKIWDDSETLRFNTSIYPLLFYMYLGYDGFLFSYSQFVASSLRYIRTCQKMKAILELTMYTTNNLLYHDSVYL